MLLCLKHPQRTDRYVKVLEEDGFNVILVPVIQFKFVNQQELSTAVESAAEYTGIVFTSKRAVESVVNLQIDIQILKEKDIYAVGPGTADFLQDKFGFASKGSETGSGEALAIFIIEENLKSSRNPFLLFPCSSLSRETMTTPLENAGIQCRRIISYETSENQDLKSIMAVLEQQSICAFFSPSGVKSAMPHFSSEHLKAAKFVAIGETTKQALENYDIDVYCAEEPTPAAILSLLRVFNLCN
ncbi:uroporphyrinogen-III synthase isoform X2 [Eurytemora carolleeae]|uniref:uroporphyrinogen-III synthase isoform X2 n=1 Tax=Eurytemora carolleeae TaxID=1294199 RepID=UPI000C782A36|nr:uroporphyrinogen-III synthase isoform X2 [Eurytemora carolleeae]|eukprot:XP_023343956.1 uroporphyrinogen-III synthase-like isoform X2 [Eurytemora affinis]